MVGTVDVDGLLDSMTPQQFNEWVAYDVVEPIVHSERLLAYLVKLVATFTGNKVDDEVLTPWIEAQTFNPNSIREQANGQLG